MSFKDGEARVEGGIELVIVGVAVAEGRVGSASIVRLYFGWPAGQGDGSGMDKECSQSPHLSESWNATSVKDGMSNPMPSHARRALGEASRWKGATTVQQLQDKS